MKILTINTHSTRGGAARVAGTIHNFLMRRPLSEGISSEMVTGWGDNEPAAHRAAVFNGQASKYINAAWFRLHGSDGGMLIRRAGTRLAKEVEDADLVHIHNLHGYYVALDFLKLLEDKPVVWTLHDFWIATGRCAFPIDCTGPLDQCARCPDRAKYPAAIRRSFRTQYMNKMALISRLKKLTITCPSHTFSGELARYGLDIAGLRVIYNGVDTAVFKPGNDREYDSIRADIRLPDTGRPVLAFAANQVADPRKGLYYLAQAMDRLEDPVTLIIIGEHKGARRLLPVNTKHTVIFTGFLQDKLRVADLLKISDYFINPSIAETFGMINLESLSCGTRPIVFALPVFRETLSDWGIFVDKAETPSLTAKIKECIADKTTNEMRFLAHKYVCDKFSEDIMCSNYLNLYKEILKQ
ncbi:MAG: glycosyltransferase [Nitrospirae bacterium]|nr:MAG: glycosyltransferase [Nitrospirota bacterium]